MKIDLATIESKPQRGQMKVYLPLFDKEEPVHSELDLLTLSLKVNPGDDDSPTYKAKFPILKGGEKVRQMVEWQKSLLTIFQGLGLGQDDHQGRRRMIERLLTGTPKNYFVTELNLLATEARRAAAAAAPAGAPRNAIVVQTTTLHSF